MSNKLDVFSKTKATSTNKQWHRKTKLEQFGCPWPPPKDQNTIFPSYLTGALGGIFKGETLTTPQ